MTKLSTPEAYCENGPAREIGHCRDKNLTAPPAAASDGAAATRGIPLANAITAKELPS
jgi:hypothetical protein